MMSYWKGYLRLLKFHYFAVLRLQYFQITSQYFQIVCMWKPSLPQRLADQIPVDLEERAFYDLCRVDMCM